MSEFKDRSLPPVVSAVWSLSGVDNCLDFFVLFERSFHFIRFNVRLLKQFRKGLIGLFCSSFV